MRFDEILKDRSVEAIPRRGIKSRRVPSTVVVGGLPTVSLLPRELRDAARARTTRTTFVAAILVALVVAGGSTGLASITAGAAQDRLASASARTQALNRELGKFKNVQKLQSDIAVGKAAVAVGASTEIDWQSQIGAIEAAMPAGFTITSLSADSANVIDAYPQGSTPLELPRAATMNLTASASDVTMLPRWLREIRSIPAYADATASYTNDPSTGYTVQVTLHLSSKSLISSGKTSR